MARLIAAFIRHGDYYQLADTPSAHQPFPLNDRGKAQAEAAARYLRKATVRHALTLIPTIDSSRMLRAWQTAGIIAEHLGDVFPTPAKVQSFDDLAERGLGCAANLSIKQIREIIKEDPRFPEPPADWKANSRYRLPLQGAESLLEAGERVAKHVMRRMTALQSDSSVLKLFVGHGAAFRHAAFHLGVLEFVEIAKLSMYHDQPILLECLPDGGWRQIEGEWKVRTAQSRRMD